MVCARRAQRLPRKKPWTCRIRKRSHFEAQVGKKVYVKTRVPVEGSKVWQGVLLEVGTESIVVQEAGREARIPLGEILSAHLIYEFR